MVWFKADDRLASSRKVLSIPRPLRAGAIGLWTLAGTWAAGEQTDGNVPSYMVEELGGSAELADALVAAGLWHETDDGFVFHDWAEYQPTRAFAEERRSKTAERVRNWRAKKDSEQPERESDEDVTRYTDVSNDDVTLPPYPTRTRTKERERTTSSLASGVADATPRPDVEEILDYLDEALRANGSKPPGRTRRNRDAARLLLDRDEHTVDQVKRAIDFATRDEFWRSNVLSMSKLREKYDQLRLAAQRSPRASPGQPQSALATGTQRAMQAAQIGRELQAQHDAQHTPREISA